MSPSQPPRGVAPSLLGLGAAPRVRLRRFAWLAFCVGASVWLWHWVSTDDMGDPVAVQNDEPAGEIEELQSFLVRRPDGSPLWELSAKRVVLSSDKLSTRASGVQKGTLYRDGKPFLKLAASNVKLSNATNDLEATGLVNATGPDGFSFQTTRAFWHSRSQVVDCPKPIIAKLRGMTFNTGNLTYDWDKGLLNCPSAVEVRSRGAVLRGKNLKASLKTRNIELSGGVDLIFDLKVVKPAA